MFCIPEKWCSVGLSPLYRMELGRSARRGTSPTSEFPVFVCIMFNNFFLRDLKLQTLFRSYFHSNVSNASTYWVVYKMRYSSLREKTDEPRSRLPSSSRSGLTTHKRNAIKMSNEATRSRQCHGRQFCIVSLHFALIDRG